MMAESNDMLGQGCGCYIQAHGTWITYCPMHKAAPDWRTALERIIVIGEEASAAHGGYLPMLNRMAAIAAEAVAQARGQEVGA